MLYRLAARRACAHGLLQYREQLLEADSRSAPTRREFLRWFDLMGLQRHIKVLGIFARLFYRDGKSQYLNDLPRVLRYVRDAAASYPETAAVRRIHRRSASSRRVHGRASSGRWL